jgi:hypothetical protein
VSVDRELRIADCGLLIDAVADWGIVDWDCGLTRLRIADCGLRMRIVD